MLELAEFIRPRDRRVSCIKVSSGFTHANEAVIYQLLLFLFPLRFRYLAVFFALARFSFHKRTHCFHALPRSPRLGGIADRAPICAIGCLVSSYRDFAGGFAPLRMFLLLPPRWPLPPLPFRRRFMWAPCLTRKLRRTRACSSTTKGPCPSSSILRASVSRRMLHESFPLPRTSPSLSRSNWCFLHLPVFTPTRTITAASPLAGSSLTEIIAGPRR